MLEVHRSQEAGNPEQPSRRYAISKDVMSLIALLLLLLVSLSLTLTTLNEDPLWLVCIIHAPQKDRFTRRNQRLYTFNEHRIKKSIGSKATTFTKAIGQLKTIINKRSPIQLTSLLISGTTTDSLCLFADLLAGRASKIWQKNCTKWRTTATISLG